MKYHKSKFFARVGRMPIKSCAQVTSKFHPLSYYLNGGIDLTGKALDKSAEVEYDTAEDLADLSVRGAMSVPYGDPRESKFSLMERYNAFAEGAPAYTENTPSEPTATNE